MISCLDCLAEGEGDVVGGDYHRSLLCLILSCESAVVITTAKEAPLPSYSQWQRTLLQTPQSV